MPMDSAPHRTGLAVSSVESLPEYVKGFPAFIAVTVTAAQGQSFADLRFANILDLNACIGIELTNSDGHVVLHQVPVPHRPENPESPGGILRDGESRRMLTDISPFVSDRLAAGRYRFRIAYSVSASRQYWSQPREFELRNPTPAEANWLATLAPDRQQALEWADWTYTQPKSAVYTGAISSENPLKLNLVLRRLFFGSESLAQVDPKILDVLIAGNDAKLFAPEVWAFRAELYQARGDEAKFRECISQINSRTNGLVWWLRMLNGGSGFLATFRLGPARVR